MFHSKSKYASPKWIICLGLISGLFLAQAGLAETDAPNITFAHTEYNFGSINQGEKVEYIFTFTNTGKDVLVIESARPTCGCTAAILSSKEIAPGEEGKIQATFNSKNFLGRVSKTIFVKSNDPDEPTVKLKLAGRIESEVVVIPPRQLAFGLIDQGREAVARIQVKQGTSKQLKILRVETDLPFVTTKLISLPGNDRRNYEIEVKVNPEAPAGRFIGNLKIHTNIATMPIVVEKLVGVVRSPQAKRTSSGRSQAPINPQNTNPFMMQQKQGADPSANPFLMGRESKPKAESQTSDPFQQKTK